MTVRLESGDSLEVIPRLVAEGVVVDSVVTDPPYHLTATVKRFQAATIGGGSDVEQRAKTGADGLGRLAGGFMGQTWDGGDVAFRPETWATIATLLRPGGFLLAFGGTRTAHRMVCAIEDAGFVIQDRILELLASDARWNRLVDSLDVEQRSALVECVGDVGFNGLLAWLYGSGFPKRRDMLKPAWEPICVAYKPGGKRTVQVDECRIPGESIQTIQTPSRNAGTIYGADQRTRVEFKNTVGRWPANVCHDGSDEVMEAFPDAPGQMATTRSDNTLKTNAVYGKLRHDPEPHEPRLDGGSAARFFYCAKAGAEDRRGSRHPTIKPVALLKWLVPLVTPKGGTFLDPFAGSGTAAVAALATGRNAILIEREPQYCADIRERIAHYQGEGGHSLTSKSRNRGAPAGTLL